jgi:signal transduction histidine kinase
VPTFGDACTLDLLVDDGAPRRMVVVTQPGAEGLLAELPSGALAGHALLFEEGGRSCLAAPLRTRDVLIGVLAFATAPNRRYGEKELSLAEELARRIALALDNARLYRGVREALQARDEFLSVAAHELRGPATSLRLAVQSLRAGEVPEEDVGKTLDLCERQVSKIARFIDELLDVSRLRAGLLHLQMDDVDLAEVAREAAAHLSHELARSGSSLEITGDAHVHGRWDRTRVDQLVTNLLSNAIKFGLGRPIELSVRQQDGKAVLQVRDHGIGVPHERQQAIFEPFERAVSARHYGGLGLGLYICRSIAEALGGSMTLKSEPGQGSTFAVTLPTATGPDIRVAPHE